MVCKEYSDFSSIEKILYTSKLIHAVQNDSNLFFAGSLIIDAATKEGLFTNVVFHPSEENNIYNNKTEPQ